MHMEVKGLKIVGQGHMISGYSNLDLPEFYNSLKAEVAFVKKCKMRDEITIIDAGANLGFYSMMFFLFILTIGFIYEWKNGALDWE